MIMHSSTYTKGKGPQKSVVNTLRSTPDRLTKKYF